MNLHTAILAKISVLVGSTALLALAWSQSGFLPLAACFVFVWLFQYFLIRANAA